MMISKHNFGPHVELSKDGKHFQLTVTDEQESAEFHAMMDGYLNCRPEAPKWLFELSDAINPVPIPERMQRALPTTESKENGTS